MSYLKKPSQLSCIRNATVAVAISLSALATPSDAQQLSNGLVTASWQSTQQSVNQLEFRFANSGKVVKVTTPFSITMSDGTVLQSDNFRLLEGPKAEVIAGVATAARLVERSARKIESATLVDPGGRFKLAWRIELADNASYAKESLSITALKQDQPIQRVDLLSSSEAGAEVVGRVAGSPVVAGKLFWMFENPLSSSEADPSSRNIALWIERRLPLQKGQTVTYSAVIGSSADRRVRRAFQDYIENERAHPYRPFLHYNSWFDIGFRNPYTATQALDRIDAFGKELVERRHVNMASFLFDDGWDDRTGSWGFSKAFPEGFEPLRMEAAKFNAAPGVWLSPWGGYGEAKKQRVATGKLSGYEIVDDGFALSGPNYYDNFRKVTLSLVKDQGVNQFKFDGTGNANKVFPGSQFDSDFDAAIHLIADLRSAKPDLFVNVTTGTYPSPAWLFYADSIWRGGHDYAFSGVGSARQRWMTYRDRETYENVVLGGPLFPLNSLMLHGVIFAQHAAGLDTDPDGDFADEVHSYFATGTGLQEMYITPSLLTAHNWDLLAAGANWARSNAKVLRDTHWVGGDPGRLDVYGWAAWSEKKAILTLRNPSSETKSFTLNVADIFEIPDGVKFVYRLSKPWDPKFNQPKAVSSKAVQNIKLKPFEVVTLEFNPEIRGGKR